LEDEKMKRKGLMMVLCVMLLLVVAVGTAQAGYYTCTVDKAGAFGTLYLVSLTDTALSPGWVGTQFFVIPTAGQNAFLAAALTAWSTGGKVQVWLDATVPFTTMVVLMSTN
jgi:hypothetical protein